MLKQEGHDPEDCRALSEVLARIGDRWTILTIGLLSAGPLRFNELRRAIEGVTQRMLTLTLRGLERDGLVVRTTYPTTPPAVEYALSERGRTLFDPLIALAHWGREHRPGIEQSRQHYDQLQSAKADGQEASGVHRLSRRVRG